MEKNNKPILEFFNNNPNTSYEIIFVLGVNFLAMLTITKVCSIYAIGFKKLNNLIIIIYIVIFKNNFFYFHSKNF